jgi:hypothetical protein
MSVSKKYLIRDGVMKKYTMTYVLMVIPAMAIGMYKPLSEMEQVERLECVRRVFIKKYQSSKVINDDAMSLSRSSSGSFPIPIPTVKKQDNPCFAFSLPKES